MCFLTIILAKNKKFLKIIFVRGSWFSFLAKQNVWHDFLLTKKQQKIFDWDFWYFGKVEPEASKLYLRVINFFMFFIFIFWSASKRALKKDFCFFAIKHLPGTTLHIDRKFFPSFRVWKFSSNYFFSFGFSFNFYREKKKKKLRRRKQFCFSMSKYVWFYFEFVVDELQGNLTEDTLRHVLNELGICLDNNQFKGLWKSVTQNNKKEDLMLSA